MGAAHQPVLYHEIMQALQPKNKGYYVDCTLGAGGHALGILNASKPEGKLLGIDVDPQALALARETLAPHERRSLLLQRSYTRLSEILQDIQWPLVNGIVLDLGASSMQFDTPKRGFSFREDAPLDMRFDPAQPQSAADLINTYSEAELAEIIFRYGEERAARRISKAILRERPIHTTGQLASLIEKLLPRKGMRVHPATRTFQALRIAVNDELGTIEKVLPQAVQALAPGGRLAIISFHSLEDRLVKQYFRHESRDCICPPRQPICTCEHKASIKEIVRKPIRPGDEEIAQNSRARSARLRIAERISG
ncbi:MAG: 16S rRNA (cytosine(1402)-N(4))-methyltransferase RsmH [Anaerolineales bacterium]|uniref:Ribosomal RNA small subunit methyltransferase H n=1 Tax=Candidatus Desulfolinea nitratireducens TaxID=2841698 RepID=A0A8J6NNB2_9CHLR|nr:16S rRNA (cytosine(1402)-N(4))-methyltransferase RsmH [Candidatus Desulfolinea nitratireducens]MBL6960795.1 16S rRNA (cytosine(1402)-N(4))-methyltransferase RsmH [Anaerolineales bacterium]